jgi:phosphoribosylaminoimidazolecarboxamide formyltransferase/IMP cyclohydrolase
MLVPIKRALISVSDKTGLIALAETLHKHGVEILSTGGTAKAIQAASIPTVEVADYTGFPEMLDGRVKTLHPKIHGGLLGVRDDEHHQAAMQQHGIGNIDLVVVNLYPFEATVAKGASHEEIIENIDIGGPSMVRSAAKNHRFVTILTDASDYTQVIAELEANRGATSLDLRQRLAAKAYSRTASYDAAIAAWCNANLAGNGWPTRFTLAGELKQSLRYGENPHQKAAFYVTDSSIPGVASAEQLQGKELSYNNINDTDAAWLLAAEFDEPAAVIVKHASPCGAATGKTLLEAYERALACDPVSAFGGIIALSRTLDGKTAEAISQLFAEVVIAPDISKEALDILSAKPNVRILKTGGLPSPAQLGLATRSVAGGLLVQDLDAKRVTRDEMTVATTRQPTEAEWADMLFGFRMVKHVKSNAIVVARHGASIGVGGGQTSRVDATEQALGRAAKMQGDLLKGASLASDAFFPFPDSIEAAAKAGITAIIQPGGSMRDQEVLEAANKLGIAMVITGARHFRH